MTIGKSYCESGKLALQGIISIWGRQNTNIRFADDIDGSTGEEDELTKLVQNLDTAATQVGM